MAVYKATQKKSDSVGKFKATEKRSYDSALVSAWETSSRDAYNELEKYRKRISSGEYLSSDDLVTYQKAMDTYVDTVSNLRSVSRVLGQSAADDDIAWAASISQMRKDYKGISDYFSKFRNADEYAVAWRQSGYQKKVEGKSYDEISAILEGMEDGEEKRWLKEYSESLMSAEDYRARISQNNGELQTLETVLEEAKTIRDAMGMGGDESDEYLQGKLREVLGSYGSISNLESRIEELKASNWKDERSIKYNFLDENADFDSQSKVAADGATAGFGIGFGKYWLGKGDPVYDYINDLDGTRMKHITATAMNGGSPYSIYDQMKPEEIAKYNYLYNTAGDSEADAYLDWLEYTLNQRRQGVTQQNAAMLADQAPVLSSVLSVPINLMSGVGALDVAGQNAWNRLKENVTGEYAGPVDYNRGTMAPTAISSTIRGTVSQNIADRTGTIHLDENKHPVFSRLLNGKSLGDVYQLGMSMADSTAVALLSPVIGTAGTALLGGSAASQGILDAIANGANDQQALMMGVFNGAFEMLFEKVSLDNLLKGDTRNVVKAFLQQGFVEGTEELNTTLANNIADILVMAEKSGYRKNISAYMAQGLSEEEATKQALWDAAIQMGWDFIGGMVSGGIMGGGHTVINNIAQNKQTKQVYGGSQQDLVGEALEIDPNNAFAQKMQGRLDSGKNLSGGQLNRIVQQNEAAITAQDMSSIQTAAESRLTELGETGDVAAIAAALTKQAAGERLSRAEQQAIANSKFAQRVFNELNPENIRSGDYSSAWAEQLDTNRINPEEYSRLVEASQMPQDTAETTGGNVIAETQNTAQVQQAEAVESPAATFRENQMVESQSETSAANDQQMTGKLTGKESLQVAEKSSVGEEPDTKTVSLEDASKKYGAQAKAMIHTYQAGQDVAKYDKAYQAAYDMGRSGVAFDYAKSSSTVSYLTDSQKELAYEAGSAASNTEAQAHDARNKAAANGKTGRKKGTVRGEGVTISDLKQTFNDTQGKAYKYLSTVAEVTGIDIVLYRSEAGPDGKFEGAQGRYRRSEPGTIYIDLNAGLSDIKNADDLAKYAMLRTFAHEFTHFIENWNPIQYNELRKVVFDTLTKRGENVQDLIEDKQARNPGMDYDKASREVVAEAMTDILPDVNFVQELAQKHKSIFTKLLEKLKEFVNNLRDYYNSIGHNRSGEANALKEQVGDTVKYLDSIVQLFDQVAVQAVENYQNTVATEETAQEVNSNEGREETREAFYRRAHEKAYTVRERGEIAYGYAPSAVQTESAGQVKRDLEKLGIQVIVHDGLEANANGITRIILGEAATVAGDAVYVRNSMKTDPVETAGHEAYHFWKQTDARSEYKEIVADNINFASDAFIQFQKKIEETYFDEEIGIEDDGADKLVEEIYAYITGLVHAGDSNNIVRPFLRDYDAVKAAWESMVQKQTVVKEEVAVAENATTTADAYGFTISDNVEHGSLEISFDSKPSDEVRNVLKENKFRWNKAKKVWYGYGNRETIRDALRAAYEAETKPAESVTATPETGTQTPSEKLASKLLESYLTEENINRGGKALTSKELYTLADEAFGGTQAEGAYNRKDAYDAMELAVNKFLLQQASKAHKSFNGSTSGAVSTVEFMQDMLDLLPTQNVRTREMEDFQQFSTPPNIAYLAAWAANITGKDMVLEPSAGIGGLAVFAKAWGAEVAVNELSKRRLEVLRAMGFDHLFNENAEQIDNILPENISPSVVIMNPPFSSTAGRTTNNKTSNAEKHIDQALARLRDGGRLVAVLGKSMNDQDYYRYWDKLRKDFNIRANISIDGSNYKKYGTTWGVQIVIIDKTGPQTGETVTGRFTDLTEIPNVLEGIRNDRRSVEENRPAGNNDSIRQPLADGGNGQSDTGHQRSGEGSSGSSADNQRKKNRKSAVADPGTGDRTNSKAAEKAGTSQAKRQDGGSDRTAGRTDSADGNGAAEPSTADRSQPEQPLQQLTEPEAVNDDGVYATFIAPEIPVQGGKKHPAVLVESAAMAAVSMPKATYKPSLPADVVKNNLSDAQLVTVTYAGQAHEQKLPDGRRKGFFVGDGTGVGKGRQIAGIILDNFMQGRTKAVWISKNNDLYGDAIRDWTATTGRSKDEVISHSRIKPKDKITLQEGILYSTYDTIKSEKGGNRLDQIVEWLGKDYDGVIAFDEAHNMGNLFGKKGKFGKSKGSEKARAGVELQRRLPNARIVYVSATAATEVDNLAYAERIGLWGQGTAFSTAQDFISKIGASGLAAMELVIRDMKAMGTYVARSISYNGVNYDTVEHALDPMQTEIYNTMSRAWQKTMSNVQSALETTGGQYNSTERQKALGNFYSSMQRFYNQVLTSMSMPSVIADMRKEIAAGHSCVLQIVNTNEAQQNKQLAEAKASGESLDNLDLTPREALVGYLTNSFPTQMFEEYTDEDGNLRSRPVMDSAGNPVQNKAAIRQRDALIEEVNQMSIPDGPLEMLFDAFGPEAVAENTGRSRRVVPRKQADGTISRVEERRTLNHRTADVQAFQDGKKRILVFSDAGGTGKSYHADRTEKNQQLRIHYVLQPGWVASNAVQGFGRTHRSNEASAPIYKLVTTNIKGQKRFTSTIARRLDQLGALTKGQRDTGSGMFGAKDNLETDLAKDSLREFYKRLGKNQIEGVDGMKTLDRLGLKQKFTDEFGAFKVNDNLARDIGTFLNRILALEVDEQNVVFDAFISIYEMELEAAIQAGTLDTGMENVKADRIEVVDDKVIREDKNTGAATHYIQAKTFTKPKVVTTVAEMQSRRAGFKGIYKTETGAIKAVYRIADKTTEWGAIQKQYRLVGPNQGAKNSVWGEMTLKEKAQAVDKADWQKEWDAEVARVPEYNEDTLHMLTGALLPIWNSLPQEGNTKVKRLIAHDGSTYLGRVIDKDLIDGVLKGFSIGRTKEVFTAKQVMDKALDNGIRFYLTNDKVQIFRSRVSGQWRLEIVQPYNSWFLTRRYPGIIQERISYRDRYFIPVGEKGVSILEKLLADNPVRNTTDDSEQYQSREYLEEHIPITVGMSDAERYEILKDRSISVTAKTNTDALRSIEEKIGQRTEDAILLKETDRKKLFAKIGEEFGVFKRYSNADVKLTFNFSKGNLKESAGKQRKNYSDFAKMLSCLDEIIDAAIGIEVHNRNDVGYKPDPTLKNVYVLVSAFEDGSNIVPVKLEIKEFLDKDNTLYVAIALESIKKDEVVKQGNTENGVTQNSRSSIIKIADLFSKINPADTSFLKYVPTQFLSNSDNTEQNQQRTDTLTDREVLAIAAKQVQTYDLTEAERNAIDIFQKRLSKLEALQTERAEQGRLYKEQQFGAKVDRAAAAETLNRMRTLDGQIQKASAEVLSVEEKTVLKRVLQKARTVVEQQERQHGQELLKRWRDRRDNAAAIKKYRDRIRGDVDELTNWVLHPDNKSVVKHIPDALKNTVLPFLSSINFMSKRSLGGGDPTVADKAFLEQLKKLRNAIRPDSSDPDKLYADYTDLPPDFMDRLNTFVETAKDIAENNQGEFIINKMTAAELQELSEIIRTLKKYIMQMNRFHVNAMFQHVYEAGDNSIDFLGQMKRDTFTGGISNFIRWQTMRAAYAFESFGKGGEAIYDGLRRGQATLAFNTKKIEAFAKKAYSVQEVKAWEKEVKTIRLGPGKTITMHVSQIMSLYELNKREQARGHIYGEGFRPSTTKKVSEDGHRLTPGELNLILRELTPRQKEVADKLQQFMQQQGGEWGNHVTVARFGEKQFGEENYFPINSDGRFLSAEAGEKPGATSLYALLNMGFTKQTQENAKNQIVVYSIFDVFANHMASMAQYNALALPLVDALKWFNYQQKSEPDENGYRTILGSVRDQMARVYGSPVEKAGTSGKNGFAEVFVINILKAFNGTAAQGTPYDTGLLKALHRYNLAQVSYNLRVVLQQPLAITRAAMLLDYASIIKGMKLSPSAIQKNIQEMQSHSGIAAWKSLGFYDVNVSRGLTELIKHDGSWVENVQNKGMWLAEKADTLTWAAIWSASKEEVIRKQHLTPKSEGFYETVTKLFEDVIYKTQVVDSVLTKNEFMRDKGFGARSLGSFMSEATVDANMLVNVFDKLHMDMQRGMSLQQAWKQNRHIIGRTLYVYAIGQVLLAVVQSIGDAWRDDDDYQEFYEKWWEAFWGLDGNLLNNLNPLNKLPLFSQINEFVRGILAAGGFDIYSQMSNFVWADIAEQMEKGVEILVDNISGKDTNYEYYGGIYKLLQAVSGLTGLPMAAATREFVTVWNNIVGGMAPSLKVKTYEPSDKSQIKYAYQDGYLTEEEAIEQLIAQGIAKNEQQARKIMKEW